MPKTETDQKDYIIVEPQEAEYWEILETYGNLLKTPDYPKKNIIWDFRNAPMKTNYEEMYKIRDLVKDQYPEHAKPDRKVALVAKGSFNLALAEEYKRIAKELPPKFKIFSNIDSAIDWITLK